MDHLIKLIVREALSIIDLQESVTITSIEDKIYLKDSRRIPRDARWCYIEIHNSTLAVFNGRGPSSKIDLSHPNSIANLSQAIKNGFSTTTLYLNESE